MLSEISWSGFQQEWIPLWSIGILSQPITLFAVINLLEHQFLIEFTSPEFRSLIISHFHTQSKTQAAPKIFKFPNLRQIFSGRLAALPEKPLTRKPYPRFILPPRTSPMRMGYSYSVLMSYPKGLDALGVSPQRIVEEVADIGFVACAV
jgi:hypothetical protein